MSNSDFWNLFYKSNKLLDTNSSFSTHVYNTYIKEFNETNTFMKIGDFGCGNCRDSRFFASKGNMVYAIDKHGINNTPIPNCSLILEDVEEAIGNNKLKTLLDVVYMRWFLHALPYDKATKIFDQSIDVLKPGGLICIEVRSLDDKELIKNSKYDECDNSYVTTHKRWPYSEVMLRELAKNKNLKLLECVEDHFSLDTNAETQNPLLIRFILKKEVVPYYEKSTNYSSYKHVIPKMRNNTFSSYKDLDILNNVLEKHGIKYVAVAGTALGLNRHGGIIPWDNDIDIGFIEKDWKQLYALKHEIEETTGLIFRTKALSNHYHIGEIDCFLLVKSGDYYKGVAKTYCHVDEYDTVYKQIFGYSYVYAPWSSEKSLSLRYGKDYFTTGNVNDNFHFKDGKIKNFRLTMEDRSYQTN
jgi:hypothetical protein